MASGALSWFCNHMENNDTLAVAWLGIHSEKIIDCVSDQTWCIGYVRIPRSDRSQTEEKRVAYEPRIVESDFSVLRSTKMFQMSIKLIDSLAIRTTVASYSNEAFSIN